MCQPLTQRDLLARWPGEPPRSNSIWRALQRGLQTGLFAVSGRGTKNDPYRFAMATQPVAE